MRHSLAIALVAGVAGNAFAGSISGSGSADFFGSLLPITTWNIASDASPTSTEFGAEGMTFFNGTLYVSHDHNAVAAAGNLVRYTPGATGDLSSLTTIALGNGPAGLWGPEGITINPSGVGYGSFAPGNPVSIVGIETRGTDSFGVFDTGSPGSNPTNFVFPTPNLDDVAYVGSIGAFAAPAETGIGDGSELRFFDAMTLALSPASSPLIDGAKGITTVSASFAQLLTGLPVATSQALIVVSELKALAVYDTTGLQIGSTVDLSAYLVGVSELESVAVDELNGLLYLGDEGGTAIHVVQVPSPGMLSIVGVAGLAGLRRRRR